jgi:hypothetical protein
MSDIGSRIAELINALMGVIALIVTPNWGALILLLPLFILPLVLLWLLGTSGAWSLVAITKRRAALRPVEVQPHPAARDAAGLPIYPAGRPFDARNGEIYPIGALRSQGGEPLQVGCPGCGAVRLAEQSSCNACGMEIRMQPRVQFERPAGPPPGGAARA